MKNNRSLLLRFNSLFIATLLCVSTMSAVAQTPNQSRRVDNVPWNTQECMARARTALQQQGYSINWAGTDAFRGIKGADSALILCNGTADRRTRVNVIVASNDGSADSENNGLWTRLRGSAMAGTSGDNTPVGGFRSGFRNGFNNGFGNSQYLGCWKDDQSRVLNISAGNTNDMTNNKCISICKDKGMPYAGTEFGNYCFCGNDYRRLGQLDESACNVQCTGDQSQNCGGSWANSVYATTDTGNNFNFGAGRGMRRGFDNLPSIENATYLGCWKDDESRVLNVSAGNTKDMTNDKCTSMCRAKGLPFAATEYGSYCACGTDYRRLGRLAESACNVQCTGDQSQNCGGSWANSVWAVQ
jgi:hypothetical protein